MWRGAAQVLQWTQDWARARELSLRVATLFVEELEQLKEVVPGVAAWLAALKSARVPCAIVSSLPTTLLKARLAFTCARSFGTHICNHAIWLRFLLPEGNSPGSTGPGRSARICVVWIAYYCRTLAGGVHVCLLAHAIVFVTELSCTQCAPSKQAFHHVFCCRTNWRKLVAEHFQSFVQTTFSHDNTRLGDCAGRPGSHEHQRDVRRTCDSGGRLRDAGTAAAVRVAEATAAS